MTAITPIPNLSINSATGAEAVDISSTNHSFTGGGGVTRALWVGGAGNVVAVFVGGNSVTITGVAAGTLLPIAITQVTRTSTTATSMLGLF